MFGSLQLLECGELQGPYQTEFFFRNIFSAYSLGSGYFSDKFGETFSDLVSRLMDEIDTTITNKGGKSFN